jgi:hypothetical protein
MAELQLLMLKKIRALGEKMGMKSTELFAGECRIQTPPTFLPCQRPS